MDAVTSSHVGPSASADAGSGNEYKGRFCARSVIPESSPKATKRVIPEIVITDFGDQEVKAEFTTFRVIEDIANQEYIDHLFGHDPQLATCRYVVSEKIDGANVTVMIDHDSIRYFSRVQEFYAERPFFNAPMALKKYLPDFRKIQCELPTIGCQTLTLRGEYFGKGICRRINYGLDRYYAPFVIEKDGATQTHQQFRAFMQQMAFCHLKPVPLLVADASFNEAMAFNPEELTTRAFTPGTESATPCRDKKAISRYDFIEGIVIQPVDRLIKDSNSPFLLKKRAEAYREIEYLPTQRLNAQPCLNEEDSAAASEIDESLVGHSFDGLSNFITLNRLVNVTSHTGDPTSPNEIGVCVMAVLRDAKKDYCKHHTDAELVDRIPTSTYKPTHDKIVELLRERYPLLFRKRQKVPKPPKVPRTPRVPKAPKAPKAATATC